MATVIASPALADCEPGSVPIGGTITCSQVDADGLVVSSSTTVRVQPGARVEAGANAAIHSSQYLTLINDGAIVGGTKPGVLINGGGELVIGSSGSIGGSSAIRLITTGGFAFANVTNSGSLTGTSGPALVADQGAFFNIVGNAKDATIGGISGHVNYLTNGGTIDGGAISAIATLPFLQSGESFSNSGTIRSSSAAATMDLGSRGLTDNTLFENGVGNSGLIENTGSGPAIVSNGNLMVDNAVGGRIAAGGGTAIRTSGALFLTNAGTIAGSVISTSGPGNGSTVDATAGTIQGDLLLGTGDDVVSAGFDLATGRWASVTGRVDGGAGTDTAVAVVSSDRTITTVNLPTSFERLRIDLTNNASVVLGANAASLPFGFGLSGNGKLTLTGDLVTTGPTITPVAGRGLDALSFENQGSIVANLTAPAQRGIDLNVVSFANSGSILANGGDGVRIGSIFQGAISNSGTVEASGTAFQLTSGGLTNSGTIRSTGGVGLLFAPSNFGSTTTNTGTINGATVGVQLGGVQLENGGTILGGQTGVVFSGLSGTLLNRAGGTIGGGTRAVANDGASAKIRNAGTINGDVDFRSSYAFDSSGDAFTNDGGIVNGSLRLGGGDDVYVTDLGTTGVTGAIDGGDGFDFIRYRIRSNTTTMPILLTGFEAIDYELIGGAALTVTGQGEQRMSLSLSGIGSADLAVDLVGSDRTLLDLTNSLAGKVTLTENVTSDLKVVSRGRLTLNSPALTSFGQFGVVNAGSGRFENAGTISMTIGSSGYYSPAAIVNGAEVINSGTISVGGAAGVLDAAKLVNSGLIVQIAGAVAAQGAINVRTLDNSGTISVDGLAYQASYFSSYPGYTTTNSGTIESRTTTAMELGSNSLVNLAGGTIRGKGNAVRSTSGNILNQGTIFGDVLIGEPNASFGINTFISDGGSVTGNVAFGGGNDLFLQRGDTTGVSGTITGGAGIDTFGRSFRGVATTQIGGVLATGFERELIEASGTSATVTLTGPASGSTRDVYLAGEGSLINRADITAKVHLTSLPRLGVNVVQEQLGAFANEGRIGAVDGATAAFRNSGTISANDVSSIALELQGKLAFSNSGTIRNDGGYTAINISGSASALSVTNTGTIAGGVNVEQRFSGTGSPATLTFDNSGTISSVDKGTSTVSLLGSPTENAGSVVLQNSGRITNTGDNGVAMEVSVYRNISPSEPHRTSLSIINSGTIEATGAGSITSFVYFGQRITTVSRVAALTVFGNEEVAAKIVNTATGRITAGGTFSTAVTMSGKPLDLDNAGAITGNSGTTIPATATAPAGFIAGAIQSYQTDDRVINSGTITGSIDLGAGNDRIENTGTIIGDVFLRDGDDVFVQRASGRIVGTVDAGAGTDLFTVDATGGGTIDASQFINFEQFSQIGTGNVTYSGQFALSTIAVTNGAISVGQGQTFGTSGPIAITGGNGSETVVNQGTIAGGVDLGNGDDTLGNAGTIAGPVDLGAGADTLVIRTGALFGGTVRGGADRDVLQFQTAGSDTAPTQFALAGFSEFEVLRNAGGVTGLSGTGSFLQIEINGGRLIGLPGSVLTGPVTVASGGTFGSAGTVIGNVVVGSGGTLSPGASPGTMTVQGNVSLASGSATVFEFTPTVSDKLLISGNLAIASGAMLNIVGDRPLSPGTPYDLIVADGGITGSFTTVNKAATVNGFLRQTAMRLQLLGTFTAPAGVNLQTATAIDHVNSVFIAGNGTAALLNSIPLLLTSAGATDTAAFARLTPEAYATAQQLGVEHGLSLAKAARAGAIASPLTEPGAYVFAQGLGNWRNLRGDAAAGTSGAHSESFGALSGIGYGNSTASVAAFVGYIDSDQHISGLAAKTDADGVVAGIAGHLSVMGLDLGVLIAQDWSRAHTTRALPGSGTASSGRYDLRSLVLDMTLGYSVPMGSDWSLHPGIGLTHVRTKRGAIGETGSVFALDVDRRRTSVTFLDGALRLQGGLKAGAKIHPWIEAGLRHQLEGEVPYASGGLAGTGLRFTAAGAERKETLATLGAGIAIDLASRVSLFAAYNGEFGSGGAGNEGNIGLRFSF